ncbi:MAG: hypothetical protein KC503_41445 [Myxococcales bacterium]|nr:hypothetical protein [Myxococcales bacterium]
MVDIAALWRFLPLGYLFTILIETPVLLVGLSAPHSWRRRVVSGVWLTAVTYPVVVLVLPPLLMARSQLLYIVVAEIFAPVAECAMFALAFHRGDAAAAISKRQRVRDYVAIVVANLLSFGIGELVRLI